TVQANGIELEDQFGASVAISGDLLVVGAPNKDDGSGAAYLFQRLGVSWTPLAARYGVSGYQLGTSVDIDGNISIIGIPGADAAYVYALEGGDWDYQDTLFGSANTEFGTAVAVDNDTAVVGAPDANGGTGAAYVYTASGSTWTAQGSPLTADDGAVGDGFGTSVDLSGDFAVVGSPLADGNGQTDVGAAYVFERAAATWTQMTRLDLETEASTDDFFGHDVAIDGERIVVGAYGRDHTYDGTTKESAGEAFAFGLKDGQWRTETVRDPLFGSDASYGDFVGYSVAISGDLAVLGAPQLVGRDFFDSTPSVINTSGTGYAFIRDVSPPITVTVPERQELLIEGAHANTVSGTLGGVETVDFHFFDIKDMTIQTGAGDDTITIEEDGLTAYGMENFTVATGAGDDLLTTLSGKLKPPAVDDYISGDFGSLNEGDSIPPGEEDNYYTRITGAFTYDGGTGTDRLVADADVDWTLGPDKISTPVGGGMLLQNVSDAEIFGGESGNLIAVSGWAGSVTIDGRGGSDQITVHAGDLNEATVGDSGVGSGDEDQLTFIGTNSADVFEINTVTVLLNSREFDYTGMEVLRIAGMAGDDTMTLYDTAVGTTHLDGGDNSDTYDVYTGAQPGDVFVHDTGPFPGNNTNIDTLVVPASSTPGADLFTTTTNRQIHYDNTIENIEYNAQSPYLTFSGTNGADIFIIDGATLSINGAIVDLSSTLTLTLNTSGGNDQVFVNSVLPLLESLVINGEAGSDHIYGPDGDTTWTLTGMNEGTVTGPVDFVFTGVENLSGGDQDDTYVFTNNSVGVSGDLDGGIGNDVLDYSGRTGAVNVNVTAGTTTAVGGTFSGIEEVIGSSAVDTLMDALSTWHITGVNEGDIDGVFAFSSMENLMGGAAADTFIFDSTGVISGVVDGADGEDTLVFNLTNASDTVVADASVVNRNGQLTAYQDIEALTLNTLGGLDSVTVNQAASGFPDTVNVNSGDGDDIITVNMTDGAATTINVDGGAPSASDSVIINGTAAADTIAVEDLTVTFNGTFIDLTDVENLTVDGAGGDDTITLTGTTVTGAVSLLGGADDDAVTLNYPIVTGGLTVDGGSGSANTLTVNLTDSPDDVTLDSATIDISGQTGVDYNQFAHLTLDAAGGTNTVTILDTHTGATTLDTGADTDIITILATSGVLDMDTGGGEDVLNVRAIGAETTISTGEGDDTLNVSSDAPANLGTVNDIGALLALSGDTGDDTLNIVDMDGGIGTLNDAGLTGLGMASSLTYTGMEVLNISLGAGNDVFTIESTHDGTTTFNAGAGSDTITVGSPVPTGGRNLSTILGTVTILGGGGADTLHLDDTGNVNPETGVLTATTVTGLGMATGITYGDIESLEVDLGSGGDNFTIESTHASDTTLNTNGGDDVVLVETTAGDTAVNTGEGADDVNIRAIGAVLTVRTGEEDDTIKVGSFAPG
ncbi:MAG: hypothetical protein KAV82_15850, partial [Phycisphaerae bacterium]|nr:hypothetical protein [Phycisphaerae bacterium]